MSISNLCKLPQATLAIHFLACLAVDSAGSGCGADREAGDHHVALTGYVYDGLSQQPLVDYTMEGQVGSRMIEGTVNEEDGRFTLRGVDAFSDYTVSIRAEGYRPFTSHNSMPGLPNSLLNVNDLRAVDFDIRQTRFYNAVLFPTSLISSAVELSFEDSSGDPVPQGTVRLAPTSSPRLARFTPSVRGQLWGNDEDVQNSVISETFSNGTLTLEEGRLAYGVSYDVDVYGAAGYGVTQTRITGGFSSYLAVRVSPLARPAVELVEHDADSCVLPTLGGLTPPNEEAAQITLSFAEDVEIADEEEAFAGLNVGLQVLTIDDGDLTSTSLVPRGTSTNTDRGADINVDGQTITLSFNPIEGFASPGVYDPDEPLSGVLYDGLSAITVRRPGEPGSAQRLSDILGFDTLTCVNPAQPIVLMSTEASCTPPGFSPTLPLPSQPTANIQVQFTAPVSLVGGAVEAANTYFSIVSPDTDADSNRNVLSAAGSRGVAVSSSSESISFGWNPTAGLATSDTGDSVSSVTYGGLSAISVTNANGTGTPITLGEALGKTALLCD